MSKQETTYF